MTHMGKKSGGDLTHTGSSNFLPTLYDLKNLSTIEIPSLKVLQNANGFPIVPFLGWTVEPLELHEVQHAKSTI
jgi:hypothetical protein